MSTPGQKIIKGLQEATRGGVAAVTIDGQRWVRSPAFEAMVEALEPFALVAEHDIGGDETNEDLFRPFASSHSRAPRLKVGDLRRARAALASVKGERA